MAFTGNDQTDTYMLLFLDDQGLLDVCQSNHYFQTLCDENFWRERFRQKFGQELGQDKPIDYNWKNWYFKLTSYLVDDYFTPQSFEKAVEDNNLIMVNYLYNLPELVNPKEAAKIIFQKYLKDFSENANEIMHWAINILNIYDNINVEINSEYKYHAFFQRIIANLDIETYLKFANKSNFADLNKILSKAIESNNNDIINRLIEEGIITGSNVTDVLFDLNRYDDVKNYIQSGYPITQNAEYMVTGDYDINKLEHLKSLGINPTPEGANWVLNYENPSKSMEERIKALNWYLDQGIVPDEINVIDLEPILLDWLNNVPNAINQDNTYELISEAAAPGNEDLIKNLIDKGYANDLNRQAVYDLIHQDDVEGIEVLIIAGYPFNHGHVQFAQQNNSQNVLDLFAENSIQ